MSSEVQEGWQRKKLSDVAEVVGGGTPPTKDEGNFGTDLPWITPKDLSGYTNREIREGGRGLSGEGFKNSSAKKLPAGTVLISSRAPIGYTAIAGCELSTNQGFRSLILKEGYSPEFFYYLISGNRELLELSASGSTFKEISGSTLGSLEFQIPLFPEQSRIAWVLGTLDDKIELNQELSRTLVEALEIQWARSTSRMEMAPLSDFANQVRKPTQPSETPAAIFEQFSIPAFDDRQQPEICLGESMASGKTQLPEAGAVLISKLNPETWRAWLANPSGTGTPVCSPEFIALTADSLEGRTWISGLALFDQPFRREVLSHSTGTTGSRQRVKPGDVLACSIPNPDPAALQVWFNFSRPLFERNQQLQDESRTLSSIRDELLPKLISGKIRVPEGVGPDLDEETATEVAEELAEA